MNEKDQAKWISVIIQEFMSSEDSDDEGAGTIIKHPLQWRSPKVDDFFKNLDKLTDE